MADTTTTPSQSESTPTHIVESYHAVENRITQAIEILQERGGQPNFAAAAREFLLLVQRLRARWNGRQSKIQRLAGNRKLSQHQELAVCEYLDRLDNIGLPARHFMITYCANAILRRSHPADSNNPPPQVSKCWAGRFLERYPEYLLRKQRVQEID